MVTHWQKFFQLLVVLLCLVSVGCATVRLSSPEQPSYSQGVAKRGTKPYTVLGKTYYPLQSANGFRETGVASWYGPNFHGKKTANGETYNMYAMTAAHKILPLGTTVRVRHLDNGRNIVVRVNDRGPFVDDRIIDLSYTAAKQLDMIGTGTARVQITALSSGSSPVSLPVKSSSSSAGKVYLQLVSLSSHAAANPLARTLQSMGLGGRTISVPSQKMWRVQAGPFTDTTKARAGLSRIAAQFPDAYIISE